MVFGCDSAVSPFQKSGIQKHDIIASFTVYFTRFSDAEKQYSIHFVVKKYNISNIICRSTMTHLYVGRVVDVCFQMNHVDNVVPNLQKMMYVMYCSISLQLPVHLF